MGSSRLPQGELALMAAMQNQMRERLVFEPFDVTRVRLVAGADLSANPRDDRIWAAVVVWDQFTGEVVEYSALQGRTTMPYVPGYLAFRELPAVEDCFASLQHEPDALLCDGHGYAHPRRMGLACAAGLSLGLPTIGCAKSLLFGQCEEPGPEVDDHTDITADGEVIGRAVRTRRGVKPVYLSVGDHCDLDSATHLLRLCSRGHRQPEPLRAAHDIVNRHRRGELE